MISKEEAKYILHEIKSINRYQVIIRNIDEDLKRISQEIKDLQTPSSPTIKNGPKIENHEDKYTIVNSLLSDEMDLVNKRNKFNKTKAEAEQYYVRLKMTCDAEEFELIHAFVIGMRYAKISHTFGYENPYRKAISIVSRL